MYNFLPRLSYVVTLPENALTDYIRCLFSMDARQICWRLKSLTASEDVQPLSWNVMYPFNS